MKLYGKCALVAQWYHGRLEIEAAEFLCKESAIGQFLVWTLSSSGDTYMLTAKENDNTVSHYVIGSYCTANDVTEEDWLTSVLIFYQSNCLDGSACFTTLTGSVPRRLENRSVVVAKESFSANDFACLSFSKGDRLHLLDQENRDWWYVHDGQNIGYIPSSCVFALSDYCQCADEENDSIPSPTCEGFRDMTQQANGNKNNGDCVVSARQLADYKDKPIRSEMRSSWRNRKELPPNLTISKAGDELSTSTSISAFEDNFMSSASPSLFDGSDVSAISIKSDASLTSSNSEDHDVIYPASCTHRPRPMDLPRKVTLSRSFSEQNVRRKSNISNNAALRSRDRGSLKNALTNTAKMFKSIKRGSVSKPSTPNTPSKESFDLISTNGLSIASFTPSSPDRMKSINESFYKSFEDLTCDEMVAAAPPKSPVRQKIVEKCTKSASTYAGPVWSEIGATGGVVSVQGSDISVHISASKPLPTECRFCFNKTKSESMRVANSSPKIRPDMRRRFSKSTSIATGPLPRLREHKCPARATLDGRIAVQLEDPPNASVINPTREKKQALELLTSYAIAGPAVRIRLADKDAIKSGAVLQIGLSVSLQRAKWFGSNQDLKKQSGISCLQSDSSSGPFHETVNCYYYGNTLQATLDTSTLRNSENGCQIYAVPVVKVDDGYLGAPFPWSCIGQTTYHVGIYGPKQTYLKSTCCVSVSCSGFSPPTLQVRNGRDFTLRLWGSYTMHVHKAQGFRLGFKVSSSSTLTLETNQDDDVIQMNKLQTCPRINKIFVLVQNVKSDSLRAKLDSKTDRLLAVTLTGLEDENVRRIKLKVPAEKMLSSPKVHSPIVKRRTTRPETLPGIRYLASPIEQKHQWLMAMQESKVLFSKTNPTLGHERMVYGIQLAVALRSRYRKRQSLQPTQPLHYNVGDYMPVLSRQTVWSHGSVHYKDWWVAYSCHKVGLVQKSNVTLLPFEDYYNWVDVRVSCGKIIQSIVEPIPHLTCSFSVLVEKLTTHVTNWLSLATLLRFGEKYVENEIENKRSSDVRQSNATFYLVKYREFCENAPKRRCFNQELITALLYLEYYDLAVELVTRYCVLSVAVEMCERWQELAALLVGDMKDDDVKLFSESRELPSPDINGITRKPHSTWKPAFNFLSRWHNRFGEDHRAAILTLYQATETLKDSPNRTWPYLTSCVILVLAVDSLRNYDTML